MEPSDVLRELTVAFGRRDAERIAALLHPDVELRLASAGEAIVGREAAREWYRQAFTSRLRFDAAAEAEQRDDGTFFLHGRLSWFGAEGGTDRDASWVITFRDGLVASIVAAGSPPPKAR
jgi:ketosteroid isomerase-like protein